MKPPHAVPVQPVEPEREPESLASLLLGGAALVALIVAAFVLLPLVVA